MSVAERLRNAGGKRRTEARAPPAQEPRRRVLKDGELIIGKSQSVVDVTIDNVSEGGAARAR